jgi:hypothetical protein
MERAICVRRPEDLARAGAGRHDRVYFGAEFCERRIPSGRELEAALTLCAERRLPMTFLTPWCTDAGIKALRPLLGLLPQRTEVAINDWGVLELVASRRLVPVLGRLLVKVCRNPAVHARTRGLPFYRRANLDGEGFQAFLLEHGIRRVELDNIRQGYSFKLDAGLKASLYRPYVYVASGKKCPVAAGTWAAAGRPGRVPGACRSECLPNVFCAELGRTGRVMLVKGNTHFYLNRRLPSGLRRWGVDRLVDCSAMPF